jgi:hypothetical protein
MSENEKVNQFSKVGMYVCIHNEMRTHRSHSLKENKKRKEKKNTLRAETAF